MQLNSVNLMDVMKQKHPMTTNENKKSITENKPAVSTNNKSKLPYVTGAVILAGLGIWGGNKLYKSIKNTKLAKNTQQEFTENIDNISQNIKENIEQVKETIKSEIENTISKGTDKKKINAQVRERLLNITDALEKAGNRRKDFYAMYDFGIGSEGLRIIEENTHNGFVNVPVLEKVARDFIADKNRNNSIIQACSLLEETYTRAYDNIINNYAVGGLGNIYNRITKESTALFEVYEKLPREEALFRIFNFSNRKLGSDSLTRIGMQAEEFRAKTVAAFKEYLQKKHG